MSTYRATIASTWSPEDAFAYMARFSNAAKWDPGVLSSEDTDPGPPRYGSTYRLVVGALGRRCSARVPGRGDRPAEARSSCRLRTR